MSVLEGSLGMLPRRIVVDDERLGGARGSCWRMPASATNCGRDRPAEPTPDITDDAVLGGRLRLKQKRRGHRVGHDAILLAAATGARPGDRAVDLGAGVGAAGLALAVRVAGRRCDAGRDRSGAVAASPPENVARNGFEQRVRAVDARRHGAGG